MFCSLRTLFPEVTTVEKKKTTDISFKSFFPKMNIYIHLYIYVYKDDISINILICLYVKEDTFI